MFAKIVIALLCIIATLVCVAAVSTVMTYVRIVKESKTINHLEEDIKTLQKAIDAHKQGRTNDLLGKKAS